MDERVSSGDDGLDQVLGGGLPMNGINLIMGLPGSGKTILCQQFTGRGSAPSLRSLGLTPLTISRSAARVRAT